MKVLSLNNYDMEFTKNECEQYGSSEHLVWGITHFEQFDVTADIMPFTGLDTLKKLSLKLKAFGDLDQELRLLTKLSQYDIIYSGHYLSTNFLSLLRKLKLLKTPIVAIAYQSPRPSPAMKIFSKLVLEGNDKIICLSEGIKRHFEKDLGFPASKLEFIEWGFNTDVRPAFPTDIDALREKGYIFTAGKAFRDFGTLLTAFEGLDFPLELIGYSDNMLERLDKTPSNVNITMTLPPTAKAAFQKKYAKLQLPPNVTVTEELITSPALLAKYENAYAVAIPLDLPHNKPFNTVGLSSLLESMCMGKATIATENSDMGIDLEKEGIGFSVPNRDSLAWKQATQELLDYPDKTREMGERARHLAEKKFNLNNYTQKVVACMRSVVSKNNG